MCPLSGMVQFLVVIVTILLLCQGIFAKLNSLELKVEPENSTIHMYDVLNVQYNVTGIDNSKHSKYLLLVTSEKPHIAGANQEIYFNTSGVNSFYSGNFNVSGNFLGQSKVSVKLRETSGSEILVEKILNIVVIREVRVIDTVFTASVATLVSIIYINFGCAINWVALYQNIKRPIGPAIGFVGQFVVMPLLSYGLGRILFPGNTEMQLGMFFTGVSPAGGASNIWTVLLDGNMDLSITMTTISTFGAFAMMPFWLFTLGKTIFATGNLPVPYSQIATYAVALVIPLFIGFLIQRYLKRIGNFLARILKILSSLLILFIIIFAIVTNLYLFELFSWQIVVAGIGLPWLGYSLGYLLAFILRQPSRDSLTIAIETGIQNTGIAIFLLRFTLPQPQADLTTVAPVAVAIMTPFPLLALFIYKKIRQRFSQHEKLDSTDENTPTGSAEINNTTKLPATIS